MAIAQMEKLKVHQRRQLSRAAQSGACDEAEPVHIQLRLGDARDLSWLAGRIRALDRHLSTLLDTEALQ